MNLRLPPHPAWCRPTNVGGLAFCLVTMVLASVTSDLQASCGDYVVIGNPRHQPLELPAVKPAEQGPAEACHGPGCRQGNDFPPLPIPIAITISPEFAAIPPATSGLLNSSTGTRLEWAAPHRSEGVVERVERPPRVGT